ncbi:hypothetical protein HMPREF0973_02032 [Prevotella veroralis F0319]|uniref:Uncharacterized protein n=1 Tax=Prevotella veroralis F0319 TaxID=649761 RepID=C9MQZ8_9BACT|nr:hypothetical protein HMPREF0973_02032 [Prevotella veroralis F0319]
MGGFYWLYYGGQTGASVPTLRQCFSFVLINTFNEVKAIIGLRESMFTYLLLYVLFCWKGWRRF